MTILIIEDDLFKFSEIEKLVKVILTTAVIKRFDNVHDTILYLKQETPSKIILDMSLPSHAAKVGEGSPLSMPAGGIEIILELRSLKKIDIPIIILTQYPDVEIENEYYSIEESESVIKELYGLKELSVAHYDNGSNEWENKTIEFLR